MSLENKPYIGQLSVPIYTEIFVTSITVTVLLLLSIFVIQSNIQNAYAQPSSPSKISPNNNNNTFDFSSVNLGSPTISSKGMLTGPKIVEVQPLPKVEITFVVNDTIKGENTKTSETGTYLATIKSDKIMYGEGKGILTTSTGEMATWIGQGIGHFLQDGKIRFIGSLVFSTPFPEKAGNLAFLNNMVGIVDYEINTDETITSKIWELK